MIEMKSCPVCGSNVIHQIGTNHAKIIDPPTNIQQAGINAILMHVVLQKSLKTDTYLCRKCRHVYLSPTYDDQELDRLYSPECFAETKRQYRKSEQATGRSWADQHGIRQEEQETLLSIAKEYRSKRLFQLITSVTERTASKFPTICDFGAGTGELTSKFTGSRRYIFDKDLSHITDSDVIPMTSFGELSENGPYDLFVLSHVLEHVPSPTDLLASLCPYLRPDGLIYIEVPIEYCGTVIKRRGIPIGGHVNYFTGLSLLFCLKLSGYESVLLLRHEIAPYGENQLPALKAIAATERTKQPFGIVRPWPLDLFIDILLTLKARKWPSRFG